MIIDFLMNNIFQILMLIVLIGSFFYIKYEIYNSYNTINEKWKSIQNKISGLEKHLEYGTLIDVQDEMIKKYSSPNTQVDDVPNNESNINEIDKKVEKEFDDIVNASICDLDVNDPLFIINK